MVLNSSTFLHYARLEAFDREEQENRVQPEKNLIKRYERFDNTRCEGNNLKRRESPWHINII